MTGAINVFRKSARIHGRNAKVILIGVFLLPRYLTAIVPCSEKQNRQCPRTKFYAYCQFQIMRRRI